jgi:hypothetical protein
MFAWITTLTSRTRAWLSPRHIEQDFEHELETHLDMLTDENIRQGMRPEKARRATRQRLGGLTQLQETNRELHGLPMIEHLCRSRATRSARCGRIPAGRHPLTDTVSDSRGLFLYLRLPPVSSAKWTRR